MYTLFFRKALMISSNCSSELNMRCCKPVKKHQGLCLGNTQQTKAETIIHPQECMKSATEKNQPRTAPPSVASLASSASFIRPSFELRYSFLSHLDQYHSNILSN